MDSCSLLVPLCVALLVGCSSENQVPLTLRLFTSRQSWNDANDHCISKGMTLAFLDYGATQFLKKKMEEKSFETNVEDAFWIGIYDSKPKDMRTSLAGYSWAVSCETLESSWTSWKSGEPQNTVDSLCVAMLKDEPFWRSDKCEEKRPFLCGKIEDACADLKQQSCITFNIDRSSLSSGSSQENSPHPTCPVSTTPLSTEKETTTEETTARETTPQETTIRETTQEDTTTRNRIPEETTTTREATPRETTTRETTLKETTATRETTSEETTTRETTLEETTTTRETTPEETTSRQTTLEETTTTRETTPEETTPRETTLKETTTTRETIPEETTPRETTPAKETTTREIIPDKETTPARETTPEETATRETTPDKEDTTSDKQTQTPTTHHHNTTSVTHSATTTNKEVTTDSDRRTTSTQFMEQCQCCFMTKLPPSTDHGASIKDQLTLDVSQLSSTRRRKISAPDSRASSAGIGIFFTCLLFLALGCLLLTDIPHIYRDFKKGCRKTRRPEKSTSS